MTSQANADTSGPWARDVEEILQDSRTRREAGLKKRQVRALLKRYGPNRLRKAEKKSVLQILLNQVKSLIVILLAIAAALSLIFQEWMDGLAITGVIAINTAIGFFMELKAVRSMEALREMTSWAQQEADPAIRIRMADTADIPREATAVVRALGIRDELKQRVRAALGAYK